MSPVHSRLQPSPRTAASHPPHTTWFLAVTWPAGDYTIVLTTLTVTDGLGVACLAVSPVMAVLLLAQPSLLPVGTRLPVPSPWSLHPLDWLFSASPVCPVDVAAEVACSSPKSSSQKRNHRPPQLGRPILFGKKYLGGFGHSSQGLSRSIKIERCFSYRCHRPAEVLYIGCWTCLLLTVAATVADSWNRRQLSSKSKLRKSKILLVSNA